MLQVRQAWARQYRQDREFDMDKGACLYIATEVMYCTLNPLARSD